MTRILVCGAGDYGFVHRALNEVNRIYGPVSCVIHSNHLQALAWQQAVSVVQITKHMPIIENPKDGPLAGSRCRDRLFAQGRPNYVIVFEAADKRETGRDEKVQKIIYRAQSVGIPVVFYTAEQRALRRKGSTLEHDDGEVRSDHPASRSSRRRRGRSGHDAVAAA